MSDWDIWLSKKPKKKNPKFDKWVQDYIEKNQKEIKELAKK